MKILTVLFLIASMSSCANEFSPFQSQGNTQKDSKSSPDQQEELSASPSVPTLPISTPTPTNPKSPTQPPSTPPGLDPSFYSIGGGSGGENNDDLGKNPNDQNHNSITGTNDQNHNGITGTNSGVEPTKACLDESLNYSRLLEGKKPLVDESCVKIVLDARNGALSELVLDDTPRADALLCKGWLGNSSKGLTIPNNPIPDGVNGSYFVSEAKGQTVRGLAPLTSPYRCVNYEFINLASGEYDVFVTWPHLFELGIHDHLSSAVPYDIFVDFNFKERSPQDQSKLPTESSFQGKKWNRLGTQSYRGNRISIVVTNEIELGKSLMIDAVRLEKK